MGRSEDVPCVFGIKHSVSLRKPTINRYTHLHISTYPLTHCSLRLFEGLPGESTYLSGSSSIKPTKLPLLSIFQTHQSTNFSTRIRRIFATTFVPRRSFPNPTISHVCTFSCCSPSGKSLCASPFINGSQPREHPDGPNCRRPSTTSYGSITTTSRDRQRLCDC